MTGGAAPPHRRGPEIRGATPAPRRPAPAVISAAVSGQRAAGVARHRGSAPVPKDARH